MKGPQQAGSRSRKTQETDRKWFRFESRIGWSEVIAICALAFSVVAWQQSWLANRPDVRLTDFPVGIGPVHDGRASDYVFVGLIPLVFTNNGGRTTSLLALRTHSDLPPVLFEKDGDILFLDPPKYDFFLTEHQIDALGEWESFLPNRVELRLDRPSPLNRPIPPGESITVFLGFTASVYEGLQPTADRLLLAIQAEFSSGPSIPVKLHVSVPRLRKGH